MSALDDRIRAGLTADREVPDLWDAVQEGARRRRARRTAAATAAVVAVMIAILGVAKSSIFDSRDSQPAPAPQPPSPQQLLDPDAWAGPTARFLDGSTPQSSDLVGLWRIRTSDDAWLMLLGANGYWTTTSGWDLFDPSDQGNRGTWSLKQGRITLNGNEGFLGKGFRQVLYVALMPDGSLHQVTRPREGRCGRDISCTPETEPERFLFDRVAPGSSLLLDILRSASGDRIDAEVADSYLRGVWVTADGHWVVTINDEGGFSAFRDSGDPSARPDDTGHVDIDDQGHLTIACRGGSMSADVVLIRTDSLDGVAPNGVRMQLDSLDSSCASGLGRSVEWIRVSARGY